MKQQLIVELLLKHLETVKVGLIVKGISDINPILAVDEIAKRTSTHYFTVAVGYSDVIEEETELHTSSAAIEKAVLWRSMPECAKRIIAFVKKDVDKLHSLAEFEVITMRDLTCFLIDKQLGIVNNTPTQNFWKAIRSTSDYYSYDLVADFTTAVNASSTPDTAIPENMWRLNLLRDKDILGTNSNAPDRLAKNRDMLFTIGQLSEDARKKLSRSLSHTKDSDKERLQKAYAYLQELYKFGNRTALQRLDYATVAELFSATKSSKSKKPENGGNGNDPIDDTSNSPIASKELGQIVADAVVSGDETALGDVDVLLGELKKHFDSESDKSNGTIQGIGGIFDDREILIEKTQTDLRKLVGKVCNEHAWGGLMETEESVLKDAISADIVSFKAFDPDDSSTMLSFHGGIDGSQALFNFIRQFDAHFDAKGIESVERFTPILQRLQEKRMKLLSNLDLIMYYPIIAFGVDNEIRSDMIEYVETWADLYHAFCTDEPIMRQISAGGTGFIARALLLIDVLYIKTPKEWKGMLLPLHPIFLWKYYEIFRTLPSARGELTETEAQALSEVLDKLPNIMSFLVANRLVTEAQEDKVLPCSGSIEMLPTFENKTNRYLGVDGTQALEDVLTRWIGFAPYTQNEVRICSVDSPDLIGDLRSIKRFMDKCSCARVSYDVYLTRHQNGNTELSKLEYSGRDYEIGEYIKSNRIIISIHDVTSAADVKEALKSRPVHIGVYFDQSTYAIDFGPNSKNLYINPLVITYDYDFDEIQHRGSIFPSSEMESGLIGDYHKMMRSADIISNDMNPRTTYNGSADMTSVVSTIQDSQVQWLVVADRDTNNYDPAHAIPIGEMQYEKRMVNVWTSDSSRIITQYMTMLRAYNLYPEREVLIDLLRRFGHIASNGLISIPRFGADNQAIDNKRKGLLGTLFAASWYKKTHSSDKLTALVASLDDAKARLWLHDSKFGNERADLIGLCYDAESNLLKVEPIEVKTRDESPDAQFTKDDLTGKYFITNHAADQLTSVICMLKEIFFNGENTTDMFLSARREVLKYQIVSECFRNIHDPEWQKQWHDILKKAFSAGTIRIEVSGILLHIKLSEATGGFMYQCTNPDVDDCNIEFYQLTAKEIQSQILGDGTVITETVPVDFDETSQEHSEEDVIIDHDIDESPNTIDSTPTADTSDVHEKTDLPTDDESTIGNGSASANVVTNQTHVALSVSKEEIEQLVRDFRRACSDYHVTLRECNAESAVVGPSVIRLRFKPGRGQTKQSLVSRLEDIGREMCRSGIIVQDVHNSDELLLDIPRTQREKVLFSDVFAKMPQIESPEQLFFPLGRTPDGKDLFENLAEMPHMLVGGSTGSGKSVLLFTMLASFLMTHPRKEEMQLVLSSSKLEDFVHFEGLPHLYSGKIISDATEATKVIAEVISEESERRGRLLADARVANIIEYNKKAEKKLEPIVVVIDEFADLSDQLEDTKSKNAFFKPVQRIAQAGRSRGIHLVICTQRPEAKLVPATTKAQLNGRVALRVNDGISSRMIIEEPDAQYLQKHGDMIYKNGDVQERAQGYLITIDELDRIVEKIKSQTR